MPVDRPGTFTARVAAVGLWQPDGKQSVGVNLDFAVQAMFDAASNAWVDWSAAGVVQRGTVWIVGKDGSPNKYGIDNLIKVFGWNGDVDLFGDVERWNPPDCQIVCEAETHEGKTRMKVQWINPYNAVPGQNETRADPDALRALKAKYGGQFRALAGNAARNAAPAAKPAAALPPAAAPPAAVAPAPAAASAPAPGRPPAASRAARPAGPPPPVEDDGPQLDDEGKPIPF